MTLKFGSITPQNILKFCNKFLLSNLLISEYKQLYEQQKSLPENIKNCNSAIITLFAKKILTNTPLSN
jgi:hypothetical protein